MSLTDELLDFEGQAVSPRDKDLRIRAADKIETLEHLLEGYVFQQKLINSIYNSFGFETREFCGNQFEKY